MLTILSYIGYGVIGFGLGGITFRNHHKKIIETEQEKFKKNAENEITQAKSNKEKYETKVLELTKINTELQKEYNRSVRNLELLSLELETTKQKINSTDTNSIENFLKNKK